MAETTLEATHEAMAKLSITSPVRKSQKCIRHRRDSVPELASYVVAGTRHSDWETVFKCLVAMHHTMSYGNEGYLPYLVSNNHIVSLGNFLDKTGDEGCAMSTFIRRYGNYVDAKTNSYRSMTYDFCKIQRGKEDGLLRTMDTESLLKALPVLQDQLHNLLEFNATYNDLTNGAILASFLLLLKDLIQLFVCSKDGIINLLEKFVEMPKNQRKDGLEIYKKFLQQMKSCCDVLKIGKTVRFYKGDIPNLSKAQPSVLTVLAELVQNPEGQERSKHVVAAAISEIKKSGVMAAVDLGQVSDKKIKRILDIDRQTPQLKENRKRKSRAMLDSPVNSNPITVARPSDDLSAKLTFPQTSTPLRMGVTELRRRLSLNLSPSPQSTPKRRRMSLPELPVSPIYSKGLPP